MSLLFVLASLSVASGQSTCVEPLRRFGPPDPNHGFPLYYQDSTLLALQPCLDLACDPALAVPNPAAPVSFPDNFPSEFFYSRAIAKLTGPGNVTGVLTLALEGSFVNGVPAAGNQIVFTRLRIRATGLLPGQSYTVSHPYGVEILQASDAAAQVPGVINFTRDVIGAPGAFATALTGGIGPLLRFASGAVPPPGTIGNPVADQTVTGSPCGQNFFQIEGPGLPVGGTRTDLFNPVIGKVALICGNGVLDDPSEQCDLGAANGQPGSCCTATCTFAPSTTACDDGDPCTVTATCDGMGNCPATGFTTAPCDDHNACTTGDTCNGAGTCVGGPPPNCDDKNVCTTDSCNPASGCVHTNNTAPCNDGNACTTHDTCSGGRCIGGPPPDCDDRNVCTDDRCDPRVGCQHGYNTAPCDDGDPTTEPDVCSAGQCMGGVMDCPPAPLDTCLPSAFPKGSDLLLRGSVSGSGSGDLLKWDWASSSPLPKEDFGNPAEGHTAYVLCIYDETGATPQLIMEHTIPAGGACSGAPCWREIAGGFVYRNRGSSDPAGLESILLLSGDVGQAAIGMKGRGSNLLVPALPLHQEARVTIQLNDGFACWQADFQGPATFGRTRRFREMPADQ